MVVLECFRSSVYYCSFEGFILNVSGHINVFSVACLKDLILSMSGKMDMSPIHLNALLLTVSGVSV